MLYKTAQCVFDDPSETMFGPWNFGRWWLRWIVTESFYFDTKHAMMDRVSVHHFSSFLGVWRVKLMKYSSLQGCLNNVALAKCVEEVEKTTVFYGIRIGDSGIQGI